MIYGLLEKVNNESAIYYFGSAVNDMTGKIKFYKNNKPQIIIFPKNNNVSESLIIKLFIKYKDDFSKGIFPSKISFEI